ncbi:Dirigent protein 8 [Zostera marina]|uniref:Dirigent protein n=1 Tax=Zostera marina TaxID=29655 RepID=A0A0K9PHT0_ZOSMR|nr:Dirigent protein 8 [Zostera marina]
MTKLSPVTILFILSIVSVALISFCNAHGSKSVVKDVRKPLKHKKMVLTHLTFYWHESFVAPNASAVIIAGVNSTDSAIRAFGTTYAYDNPLTIEPIVPTTASEVVGRAQGYYTTYPGDNEIALGVIMNVALKEEMFVDSILTFEGRILSGTGFVREVPVIGGSGVFRYATGYYQSEMLSADPITRQNIVKFDVYVNMLSK